MSNLAQVGTIRYNGYTLAGAHNSVQLQVAPVQDSTGRAVTHSVYTFSVEAWITSSTSGSTGDGSEAGAHMKTIRGALQQNGGALTITGFGFGDMVVNTTQEDRDVAWGPKTLHLDMRPIGVGCIFLQWVVEVAIKTCSSGSLSGVIGRLKEYAYNVRWTIKPNGCTIRTTEGHLAIFLNTARAGGKGLDQTADDYRDLVTIDQPKGFLRFQPQEYHLSEDKSQLHFIVVDEEQESDNAYPSGVVKMKCTQAVSTTLFGTGANPAMQTATIAGNVEMAKPYPVSLGWDKAVRLIQERLVHAFNSGGFPILTQVSLTEDLFERKLSFSVSYMLQKTSIGKLVTGSGLFTALQSTNQEAHRRSMSLPWGNRGSARLAHDPGSDRLADACSANVPLKIRDKIAPYFFSGSRSQLFLQCPPKANSYLIAENLIEFGADTPVISVDTMPTAMQGNGAAAEAAILGATDGMKVQMGDGFQRSRTTQTLQRMGDGKPHVRIVVRGRAYRVGYPIDVPVLTEVLGKKRNEIIQTKAEVVGTITGFYGDCTIYAGTWLYEYQISFDSKEQLEQALNTKGLASAVYGKKALQNAAPKQ